MPETHVPSLANEEAYISALTQNTWNTEWDSAFFTPAKLTLAEKYAELALIIDSFPLLKLAIKKGFDPLGEDIQGKLNEYVMLKKNNAFLSLVLTDKRITPQHKLVTLDQALFSSNFAAFTLLYHNLIQEGSLTNKQNTELLQKAAPSNNVNIVQLLLANSEGNMTSNQASPLLGANRIQPLTPEIIRLLLQYGEGIEYWHFPGDGRHSTFSIDATYLPLVDSTIDKFQAFTNKDKAITSWPQLVELLQFPPNDVSFSQWKGWLRTLETGLVKYKDWEETCSITLYGRSAVRSPVTIAPENAESYEILARDLRQITKALKLAYSLHSPSKQGGIGYLDRSLPSIMLIEEQLPDLPKGFSTFIWNYVHHHDKNTKPSLQEFIPQALKVLHTARAAKLSSAAPENTSLTTKDSRVPTEYNTAQAATWRENTVFADIRTKYQSKVEDESALDKQESYKKWSEIAKTANKAVKNIYDAEKSLAGWEAEWNKHDPEHYYRNKFGTPYNTHNARFSDVDLDASERSMRALEQNIRSLKNVTKNDDQKGERVWDSGPSRL